LDYRLKYAELIKVENEEPNDYCDFCGGIFVNAEFVALIDRHQALSLLV